MGIDEQYEEWLDKQMQQEIKAGICPHCKHKGSLIIEEVDIGVGTERRPPYCADCGWSIETEQEKMLNQLMKGERRHSD